MPTDDNAAWGHLPCPEGYGGVRARAREPGMIQTRGPGPWQGTAGRSVTSPGQRRAAAVRRPRPFLRPSRPAATNCSSAGEGRYSGVRNRS
jgi:hypothetical protein